jgi:photosystem II stability/assembly factor-like uncharacterized protein
MRIAHHTTPKIVILSLGLCILMFGCGPAYNPEDAFGTEQTENPAFSVRVTAYREKRSFAQALGGAYYVFEAKNRKENNWRQFLVVKSDDPEPIDKNSISLLNEKVGYGFMHTKLAVTTDAGRTWSIWDISKTDSLKDDRSCWIENVNIAENGSGTMSVKCSKSTIILSTKDYGITWEG